jgi:hypothetical protein
MREYINANDLDILYIFKGKDSDKNASLDFEEFGQLLKEIFPMLNDIEIKMVLPGY